MDKEKEDLILETTLLSTRYFWEADYSDGSDIIEAFDRYFAAVKDDDKIDKVVIGNAANILNTFRCKKDRGEIEDDVLKDAEKLEDYFIHVFDSYALDYGMEILEGKFKFTPTNIDEMREWMRDHKPGERVDALKYEEKPKFKTIEEELDYEEFCRQHPIYRVKRD